MAADGLWASLIVDGHHLPASVVQTMVRAKTLDRLLLTCDASPYAGSAVGRYRDWEDGLEVLPEGKIVVAGTPYLAGSWAFLDTCIAKLVEMAGVSLADALDLASAQPRRLLGLAPRRLEVGQAGGPPCSSITVAVGWKSADDPRGGPRSLARRAAGIDPARS